MLNNISNLGSVLNKTEQKLIQGGLRPNSGGLLCHNPNRFTPTTCPGGTTYSNTWNSCCYNSIHPGPPIEN